MWRGVAAGLLDTPFPALVKLDTYAVLASFDELVYNAIAVWCPLLA